MIKYFCDICGSEFGTWDATSGVTTFSSEKTNIGSGGLENRYYVEIRACIKGAPVLLCKNCVRRIINGEL